MSPTTPDWRKCTPHWPLDPGDAQYIAPPDGRGHDIANWVRAGGSTVLIGGPVGVGKSTELAAAAHYLEEDRIVCLLQLDRKYNMRKITAGNIHTDLQQALVDHIQSHPAWKLSHGVREYAQEITTRHNKGAARPFTQSVRRKGSTGYNIALLRELHRAVGKPITLLVDGLEKVPPGNQFVEIFESLGELPPEAEIVAVVPWHVTFGTGGGDLIRPGERLHMLRPLEFDGEGATETLRFFKDILAKRLNLGPEFLDQFHLKALYTALVKVALSYCGGIPRTFLQIVADAGTYAKLNDRDWPNVSDLADAIDDMSDSFRRALQPGDEEAIRAAEGTDGRELGTELKIRLMSYGFLLEQLNGRTPVLHMHPLAAFALDGRMAKI